MTGGKVVVPGLVSSRSDERRAPSRAGSAATPTASRSPTTGSSLSPTAASAFAGAPTPMAIAWRSWSLRSTSFSAGSRSTSSPTASSASVTSVCSRQPPPRAQARQGAV